MRSRRGPTAGDRARGLTWQVGRATVRGMTRLTDNRDWTTLPPDLPLAETVAGPDVRAVPDPEAGRNRAQHEALRDD